MATIGFPTCSVPGIYTLTATGDGYQPFQVESLAVTSGRELVLAPKIIQKSEDVTRLDPFVVHGRKPKGRPFDRSQTPFMKPRSRWKSGPPPHGK